VQDRCNFVRVFQDAKVARKLALLGAPLVETRKRVVFASSSVLALHRPFSARRDALGEFELLHIGRPYVVEYQQRLPLTKPFLCCGALHVRRAHLNVNRQTIGEFGGDRVERALAAELKNDSVEVLLCLPGEAQRQRGLARTRLAVQQEGRGLGGEGGAQPFEIGAATDEVSGPS